MAKGVVKRFVVAPDLHFPLHSQPALNVVKKAIEIIKPSGWIQLGDVGEFHAFSAWKWKRKKRPPLEFLIDDFDKDVKDVNAGMDQIDESLDKANVKEKIQITGNHDEWCNGVVNTYPYIPQYRFKNALKLKERGYKCVPFGVKFKVGKCYFYHGHEYSSVHHCANHLRKLACNIIYGHHHDLQQASVTNMDGPKSAWSLGCLKDMSSEANSWLNGRSVNWAHAFGVVDFYRGGHFTVHVVQIINGKTSLWGELIDGNKK